MGGRRERFSCPLADNETGRRARGRQVGWWLWVAGGVLRRSMPRHRLHESRQRLWLRGRAKTPAEPEKLIRSRPFSAQRSRFVDLASQHGLTGIGLCSNLGWGLQVCRKGFFALFLCSAVVPMVFRSKFKACRKVPSTFRTSVFPRVFTGGCPGEGSWCDAAGSIRPSGPQRPPTPLRFE